MNKEREEADRKKNEKIYKENEQAFLHTLEKEEKAKERGQRKGKIKEKKKKRKTKRKRERK